MQKIIINWMLATILTICGAATASVFLTSCGQTNANEAEAKVVTTELIRTDKSWDGVDLPDYLQGRPEIVGIKYEIPAGQRLGMHYHPVMNFGILVQGDLTIISEDGLEKVVHEGEAVVEMVGTVHHGENRGTKPVVALQAAFFVGTSSLRHPFAFAIHQNGVFGGRTALLPSPSTKTAFLVDGHNQNHPECPPRLGC